jgi:hypothetical protein
MPFRRARYERVLTRFLHGRGIKRRLLQGVRPRLLSADPPPANARSSNPAKSMMAQ